MNTDWDLTPRQQFGQQLKKLRDTSGKYAKDLAAELGVSSDLVSRLELGERWPKPELVRAWVMTTADQDHAESLVSLLGELRERESRLRAESQGTALAQEQRSRLFGKASRIRAFAATEIPFFLQTAAYARQDVGDIPGVADVVRLRRADNEKVGTEGKYFEIILAESALRFFPGDARTMRDQLSELQRLVGKPGVEIGVIPFGPAGPLRSSFSVFDDITIVDSFAAAIDLTPKHAPRYIDLMDRLWEDAVRGEAVRECLTAAMNALPAS